MDDHQKTKKQLITELVQSRKRITQLELTAAKRTQLEEGKAKQALRETSARYSAMIENIGDVIGIVDIDGMTIYQSPNIERWFGWKPEEIIGTNGWDKMHPDDIERIQKEFIEMLEEETPRTVEYRFRCKNGKYKLIELTAANRVNDPAIGGVLVNYRDITERKYAEATLRQRTQLLQASQSIAQVGGWELDIATNDLFWTAETYRIHDTSPEEFNPTVDAGVDYYLPASRQILSAALEAAIEHGEGYDLVLEVLTTKDRRIDVRTTCEVTIQDGQPVKLTGIFQDITKQKEAEKALQESESRFKAIAAHTPDHIVMHDSELRYTMVINPQLGLTEEDILGKTDYDFLPQEEAETIVEAKKKVMKSGKPMHFETSLISLSGEAEFFTGTFMPIFDAQNQTNGLIGYFRNITESKKAEEKIYLQASLIEQVDSAIITIDFDNKILSWNDHAETLYQWKKDEAIGKDIIELLGAEELKEETLKNFEDLNRDGHWEGEYSVKRKDGSRLPVHIVNTYLKDKNGEKIGFIGVSNDITERKQASEALAESEEKFSKIFERSPMAIFLLDPISRNFIDMNNAFKTLFGYAEEELIGQNIDEFNMIVDHEKDIELQKRLEEYGKVDSSIINYRKKDGTIGWAIGSGELLNISGQQLIMSILIDITDQKEAEDAIRFQANLLKAVEQSVIVTNPDGEIIYWNPFAEKTYGWASEEAVGQNIVDVTVPRLSKEQAADIMETLNAGNSWSGEFEVQHRDGTIFPSFVSDTPVCNDKREISAVISVSTDISERKQTETELENYRNDLEKKVEQRTKEVQTKMEERQKLFDLMVGREVRMAELKKVIKKLRTQIEDAGLTPMANDPLLSD